jgi:hypothetical protein
MPAACSLNREVTGSTALYRLAGKFEGPSAFELVARIERDPLSEMVLDFSQVGDFVDYGIAVLANSLLALPHKTVEFRGLRQHQSRLFKYFGVNAEPLHHELDLAPPLEEVLSPAAIAAKIRRGAA